MDQQTTKEKAHAGELLLLLSNPPLPSVHLLPPPSIAPPKQDSPIDIIEEAEKELKSKCEAYIERFEIESKRYEKEISSLKDQIKIRKDICEKRSLYHNNPSPTNWKKQREDVEDQEPRIEDERKKLKDRCDAEHRRIDELFEKENNLIEERSKRLSEGRLKIQMEEDSFNLGKYAVEQHLRRMFPNEHDDLKRDSLLSKEISDLESSLKSSTQKHKIVSTYISDNRKRLEELQRPDGRWYPLATSAAVAEEGVIPDQEILQPQRQQKRKNLSSSDEEEEKDETQAHNLRKDNRKKRSNEEDDEDISEEEDQRDSSFYSSARILELYEDSLKAGGWPSNLDPSSLKKAWESVPKQFGSLLWKSPLCTRFRYDGVLAGLDLKWTVICSESLVGVKIDTPTNVCVHGAFLEVVRACHGTSAAWPRDDMLKLLYQLAKILHGVVLDNDVTLEQLARLAVLRMTVAGSRKLGLKEYNYVRREWQRTGFLSTAPWPSLHFEYTQLTRGSKGTKKPVLTLSK